MDVMFRDCFALWWGLRGTEIRGLLNYFMARKKMEQRYLIGICAWNKSQEGERSLHSLSAFAHSTIGILERTKIGREREILNF